ncbi:hypothetical protein HHK36_021793 [Tetracentron sinense]|uniref:Rad7 n=1 Tax=Tetracentron sinense TaxID=13715 RepID=A0A834YQC7_TETSI|nr:hypothetical protein HHK36_021793 [Tetracentron sinense]
MDAKFPSPQHLVNDDKMDAILSHQYSVNDEKMHPISSLHLSVDFDKIDPVPTNQYTEDFPQSKAVEDAQVCVLNLYIIVNFVRPTIDFDIPIFVDCAEENGMNMSAEKSNDSDSDSDYWNQNENSGDLVQDCRTKKARYFDSIKEKTGASVELVLISDSESEGFMTAKEAKGKGKLEIDLNSPPLDLVVEDGRDEEFPYLQSGTRIAKRRMEGTDIGSNCIEIDSDDHESEGSENSHVNDERGGRLGLALFLRQLPEFIAILDESQAAKDRVKWKTLRRREDKIRSLEDARERASRFVQRELNKDYTSFSDPQREIPSVEAHQEIEDCPTPFSTALNIIKERAMKLNTRQENSTSASVIEWRPSKDRHRYHSKPLVPSLHDLCLNVIAKNAEAIFSLENIPDVQRHKLSQLLCDSQRMDWHFMNLLSTGSPTEIRVKNCSWMTEEQLTGTFEGCDTKTLTVLQLDLCGRCLHDYMLRTTLARSSNSLPALVTISLRGACRLTDIGLNALVVSAPGLRSINLGHCSLLTLTGINTIADSLGSVLKELYIDDCQNIDAMLTLPALRKLQQLQVLSVAGNQTVCDEFVSEFINACGPNIKDLVLADCGAINIHVPFTMLDGFRWCRKLTDTSLKVIARTCPGLCTLDLVNLQGLTDNAIRHLANGCQSLQTLKLCRNAFSDEAIAAFLEASGESLKELSLNYINKVGHNTAISLAKRSRKLLRLDLSWCRKLTDEALGLIVDSCLSLRLLKLFGCTQITNVFLDGHSNALVRIIGLKMIPILEHLNVLDSNEGPLRYP